MDGTDLELDPLRREIAESVLSTEEEVEAFRVRFLGRKGGVIRALFSQLGSVSEEERKRLGQEVNDLKTAVEDRIRVATEQLSDHREGATGEVDLSLPGRRPPVGSIHPLTQTLGEIKRVFRHFGFHVAEGPEIEDDWHNFTALNFPPDHPARDMQDTLFVAEAGDGREAVMMRTHTSPVQIRVMEREKPPIRVIVPGRVYRNEAISYKSFCLFHQVEGLYVDEGVTFADLKRLLHLFAQVMFGSDVRMRFRPSFFPFTEPSAEVDIWWGDGSGSGRWMEILGCGMVDPHVLQAVGIDPERYTGYAFGMGVERIALIRHDIEDIRLFYENDVRFLQQF